MDFIDMCSRIESETSSVQNRIKCLERQRIALRLKGFVEDEVRLGSCIDEIQAFHRDMFFLPATEGKQAAPLKKDDTKFEHHVTEPGCSRNVPSNSMGQSTPSQPRLTLKIPKYLLNETYSTENDSDAESFNIEEQLNNFMAEIPDIKNELNDFKDASHGIKYESGYVKDSSDSSKSESDSSKNDSNNSKSESNSSKSELSDEEKKLGKTLLLGLLVDREKGITNDLLHLISKFSSFQSDLRNVEVTVAQIGKIFPRVSNDEVKELFQNLSESVLYLDKTISHIQSNYINMLDNLER